jgi:hypothetical protein
MDSKKVHEGSEKYICINCKYNTVRQSQYDRHLMTAKHLRIQTRIQNTCEKSSENKDSSLPSFKCACGNLYKYRQGLVKHKKKCSEKTTSPENRMVTTHLTDITNPEIIIEILKQNQEFKSLIIEQQKENKELINKVIELSKEPTTSIVNHGTVNNNNNQKQFNLQFFLNDTCKDAITIKQFIDNIQISLEDLESVGKNGYVKGISDIVLKELHTLDVTKRPIHCTDIKREVIYLKEEDTWNKDDHDNTKLKNAIRVVEDKNWRKIPEWQHENPSVMVLDSPEYVMREKIMRNVCGNDNVEKMREKVVKVIAKDTHLEKENQLIENPLSPNH